MCRGERTRTADPRVPNAVRYQLRYTPSGVSIMPYIIARQGGAMPVSLTFVEPGIACLEVNRPEVRNALDWPTMDEFAGAVRAAGQAAELRVLVITGAGPSFVAGGDLKALHSYTTAEDGRRLSELMTAALRDLERLPVPVIAAINGPARGGGAEIALACDLRVMAADADLGFVQVTLGLIPGWGGGQRLLRLVGYCRALEWLVSGRVITTTEAAQTGLINAVAEPGKALEAALELARQIYSHPPEAVTAIKRFLLAGLYEPSLAAARVEQELFPALWASPAHLQAVERFLGTTRA
jgi:enoyl-CoA hydratase/carnithine racemase